MTLPVSNKFVLQDLAANLSAELQGAIPDELKVLTKMLVDKRHFVRYNFIFDAKCRFDKVTSNFNPK